MDNLLDGSSVTVVMHNVEVGHSTETLQGMRQCCYDNHWTLTSHTNLAAKKHHWKVLISLCYNKCGWGYWERY